MTERERIQALLVEGKITPAEAELLLDALGDLERAEAQLDALEAPPPPASATDKPPQGVSEGPKRWMRVEVSAGDLTIKADERLSEPQVRGDVDLQREGDDFIVRGRGGEGLVDGLLGGILSKHDVTIRLPPGFGVALSSTTGDVTIEGVAFVKGRMTSGDISLKDVGGIDLTAISGDIDARLRLTHGQHTLKATSGDVEIKLLPGSSVRVEGHAKSGDISLPHTFTSTGRLVAREFSGTVGEGRAVLKLNVIAGDLEIEVADG